MPLRVAQHSDTLPISRVLACAFHDEELNAYFFPTRNEYPDDYLSVWRQEISQKWWNWNYVFVVSYENAACKAAIKDSLFNDNNNIPNLLPNANLPLTMKRRAKHNTGTKSSKVSQSGRRPRAPSAHPGAPHGGTLAA